MRGAWLSIGVAAILACANDDAGQGGDSSESTSGTPPTTSSTTIDPSTTNATSTTASTTTSADESTSTTGTTGDTGSTSSGGPDTDGGVFDMCFADQFVNDPNLGPDYDQFMPTIGSHCLGTNHQDIMDVERVVFLGDSITVGTPPTLSTDIYRSKLADALGNQFGLMWGQGLEGEAVWQFVDPFNGTSAIRDSGDFSSCAKWGARNDDLLQDNTQLEDCFPVETRELVNLVVITSGGNDLQSLTKAMIDGATMEMLWAQVMDTVQLKREAVQWLKDPERFPNGTFVMFANIYEFTDGTGDVMACDVSGLAGFDQPVPAPDQLADLVIWANEQYMEIAVETGSDMIFLLESFCGHGFHADDPMAPCYRGPNTDVWFDLTCIHPNPTGHQQVTDMFMAVVNE